MALSVFDIRVSFGRISLLWSEYSKKKKMLLDQYRNLKGQYFYKIIRKLSRFLKNATKSLKGSGWKRNKSNMIYNKKKKCLENQLYPKIPSNAVATGDAGVLPPVRPQRENPLPLFHLLDKYQDHKSVIKPQWTLLSIFINIRTLSRRSWLGRNLLAGREEIARDGHQLNTQERKKKERRKKDCLRLTGNLILLKIPGKIYTGTCVHLHRHTHDKYSHMHTQILKKHTHLHTHILKYMYT